MTAAAGGRGRPRPETLEDLKAFVLATWHPGPAGTAVALLDRAGEIVERGETGYGGLAAMLDREVDKEILTAVTILCSSSIAVFDIGFVLREDGRDIPLDARAVSEANFSKRLAHPVTGEQVEDWEGKTYPFVTANDYLRELLAREAAPAPPSDPVPAR